MTRPAREPEVLAVPTRAGPGRLFVDPASEPRATLVLGHGAGGGVAAPDLELLARRLPAAGGTVVRFEQPWRTAGGRVAVRPERLDLGWVDALEHLLGSGRVTGPLYVGGRSAGARVACRTASAYEVAGVVCLAFPLHLPGRPERSRLAELLTPTAPRLVLQGTRDAFGSAAELEAAVGGALGITVVPLTGADHSFRAAAGGPMPPVALRDQVVTSVLHFLALKNAGVGPAGSGGGSTPK
ncbi:MAG: alpha/beta family hydrolase [Actinomycetes bacterium]